MAKNTEKNAKDYNRRAKAKYQKEKIGMVTLKFKKEEKERLKKIAESEGKSLSQYIKDKIYGEDSNKNN